MTTLTKAIVAIALVTAFAAPASARVVDEGLSAYPKFGAEGPGYWQNPGVYVNRERN